MIKREVNTSLFLEILKLRGKKMADIYYWTFFIGGFVVAYAAFGRMI